MSIFYHEHFLTVNDYFHFLTLRYMVIFCCIMCLLCVHVNSRSPICVHVNCLLCVHVNFWSPLCVHVNSAARGQAQGSSTRKFRIEQLSEQVTGSSTRKFRIEQFTGNSHKESQLNTLLDTVPDTSLRSSRDMEWTRTGHGMDTKWTWNVHLPRFARPGTWNGHEQDTLWTRFGHLLL